MNTKRETRTTYAWNEGDIKALLAKHLFEQTGVDVQPSQILKSKVQGHPEFVNYAVIIREKSK